METFGKVDVVFRSSATVVQYFIKGYCFTSLYKGLTEKKNLLNKKYFQLENEYHQKKGLEKLSKKHTSIITIAGIHLEIRRSKVFKKY